MSFLTKEDIINGFIGKIKENGGKPSEWYTGIAKDPNARLKQHKVNGTAYYGDAGSEDVAREIEDYMIKVVKTQGHGGGGDGNSKFAYCYKITPTTDQDV